MSLAVDTRAGTALRIDGVAKEFGATRVLGDIDIAVAPGEFLAIVGRSGCGKSTLLRLLAGLDTPTGGRILFDGAPAAQATEAVRLMFQEARLLPWQRVLDNVGIGRTGSWRAEAMDALRLVGLEARAHDWPGILSGGQKQRVALARALVSRPRLLLMDEPLGALDALTRLDMQALIETVWQREGFTAILVTHDVAEAAALADRVIVLDAGRIAASWAIDIPRPRPRASPALAAIEAEILDRLMRRA
jgi:sulfonate transport system ATP-binding protein